MPLLFAHRGKAIRIPNLEAISLWIPKLYRGTECWGVRNDEADEAVLNRADNCRLSGLVKSKALRGGTLMKAKNVR
jgi:hypothetical protein